MTRTIRRRAFLEAGALATLAAMIDAVPGQGAETRCYMPGDTIDRDVFVHDATLRRVRLLDAVGPGTKAVVLVIFGGAYRTTSDKHGGIWCEDSLDEFANLKAAGNRFKDQGVQQIGIACPPVYSDRYGFDKDVFLDEADESPRYRAAVEQFVERTEALRRDRTIPIPTVLYDPRFRLLWNAGQHPATPAYGKVFAWQGRFKWHKDDQRYGTPCVWFLSPAGKVLREPLWGNNYSAEPPRILFTYWELEGAITQSLEKAK